ncbi:phosphogluconate dehydratase, partial [Rhizobiaceae sp. 2RAB30]
GLLEALVPPEEFAARKMPIPDLSANGHGFGRELFEGFRQLATRADHGASAFGTA